MITGVTPSVENHSRLAGATSGVSEVPEVPSRYRTLTNNRGGTEVELQSLYSTSYHNLFVLYYNRGACKSISPLEYLWKYRGFRYDNQARDKRRTRGALYPVRARPLLEPVGTGDINGGAGRYLKYT